MNDYLTDNQASWDGWAGPHAASPGYAVDRFLADPEFISEGHPMLWSLDASRDDDLLAVRHPYFEQADALVRTADGTYVETDTEFTGGTRHMWNHGIGEIVTALLGAGMTITGLVEHQSVPWEALPGQLVRTVNGKDWKLAEKPERMPLTYTLQAVRTA